MDKIKSLSVKRLSFNRKVNDQKVKSSVAINDDSSYLTEDEKGSSTLKHKSTILKIRSCVTLEDPELVNKFQNLFDKDSSEVLLKRYKCIYTNQINAVYGKMYISSNYLCFVESKERKLELVIQLKDVEDYVVNELGVNIVANGRLYSFRDFNSESWFGFLSNYLRLTKKTNNPVKFDVSPDSTSLSTSISSLSNSNCPDTTSNLKSAEPDRISPTRKASNPRKQSTPPSQSPSHVSSPPLNMKTSFGNPISMVSDVAYKASCIPLLILTRVLSFGMGLATSSLQVTTTLNILPPRAFTKNVACAMLAFLAISMAYMYCRMDQHPIDDAAWNPYSSSRYKNVGSDENCRGEFEKIASTLNSLSESLQRLEARLLEDEIMMNLGAGP